MLKYPKISETKISNRRVFCDGCKKYSLPHRDKLNDNVYCYGCNNKLLDNEQYQNKLYNNDFD